MHVFISHIHEEAAVARAIKRQLESNFGELVTVFLAEDIPLGRNWFEEIRDALVKADLVLVLFSPYSVDRPWVNIEAGYGVMANKIVIPMCCLSFKIRHLPIVYSLLQSVEVDNPDDVGRLLERIASMTEARRLLTRKEEAVESWLRELKSVAAAATSYFPPPGSPPVVWIIGSHTSISQTEAEKALEVTDILARAFVNNGFQIVMGVSRLLSYFGDKIAEILDGHDREASDKFHQQIMMASVIGEPERRVPSPVPIVILGSLRSERGVRRIFLDAIGKIPDVAVVIGGNKEGRTPDECKKAMEAQIPILPLSFTGGFASMCSSTFDNSLSDEVAEIQKMSNRVETLARKVVEVLLKQVQIQRQHSVGSLPP